MSRTVSNVVLSLTWHARWNVAQIHVIYFTCLVGKEPIKTFGEEKRKKRLKVVGQLNLPSYKGGGGWSQHKTYYWWKKGRCAVDLKQPVARRVRNEHSPLTNCEYIFHLASKFHRATCHMKAGSQWHIHRYAIRIAVDCTGRNISYLAATCLPRLVILLDWGWVNQIATDQSWVWACLSP